MEGTPLLDVLRGLILDPEAQADFAADPSGYMQRFGHGDVPEEDLSEAVGLVADTLPPDVAHAVTTAAASPSDDDPFGAATGLLGRISTAEVTESVVPPLDDRPDLPAGQGADDDLGAAFSAGQDSMSFGGVTRDFDAETDVAGEPGDVGPGGSLADETAEAAGPDRVAGADETGEATAGPGEPSDLSFGDGDLDAAAGGTVPPEPAPGNEASGDGGDVDAAAAPAPMPTGDAAADAGADGPEAFGQGSGAAGDPSDDDLGDPGVTDSDDADGHDLGDSADVGGPVGPDPDDPSDSGDAAAGGLGAGPPPVPGEPGDDAYQDSYHEADSAHPAGGGFDLGDGEEGPLDGPGGGPLDGDPGLL